MTVQDLIQKSLEDFGMDVPTWNKYNLMEVSLEKGIAERTVNAQEEMLQLIRNLRKVWPNNIINVFYVHAYSGSKFKI
jgi:hypothetical protein